MAQKKKVNVTIQFHCYPQELNNLATVKTDEKGRKVLTYIVDRHKNNEVNSMVVSIYEKLAVNLNKKIVLTKMDQVKAVVVKLYGKKAWLLGSEAIEVSRFDVDIESEGESYAVKEDEPEEIELPEFAEHTGEVVPVPTNVLVDLQNAVAVLLRVSLNHGDAFYKKNFQPIYFAVTVTKKVKAFQQYYVKSNETTERSS